jgi:hypothetical protein
MPPIRPADLDAVSHPSTERSWGLLAQDASPTAIAEAAGVSPRVDYPVQDDPAKAEGMLAQRGV